MSFSFNGLSGQQVVISGGISITSQSANVKFAANESANGGTVTIGTVPAGKQWRLLGISLNGSQTTASSGEATMLVDGAVILAVHTTIVTSGGASACANLNFNYAACPIVAATKVVSVTSSATGNWGMGQIIYVEEPTGT